MNCPKSKTGLHNFPYTGANCANGCGVNQTTLSGGLQKQDLSMHVIFNHSPRRAGKATNGIHSALHAFVDDIRTEFGETAKKGVGSFGFYLGFINRLGLERARTILSELHQGHVDNPKKLFWWKLAKELKERKP